MDFTIIQQFISSVGFPIACCVYMMVCNNKTLKELTNAVNNLTMLVQTLHGVDSKHVHEEKLSYVKGDEA